MADTSAFLDQHLITGSLYEGEHRLASRTGALMAAKTSGRPTAAVIAAHASAARPGTGTVLDIGCGRGASTLALAQALPQARVCAVDASAALLNATRARLRPHGLPVHTVRADFHRLPLPTGQAALAVAAFCLYHSPTPQAALTEIARCLAPGATLILATKAADSYASLYRLVAKAGLDPDATRRPSLYSAFHSGNFRSITESAFTITHVEHEAHRFRFRDFAHVAAYLATTPKYRLPDELASNAAAITDHLQRTLTEGPVETASVVSYLTATRPGEHP